MKPRYLHDCSACRFLGAFSEHDLWCCFDNGRKKLFGGSLISRHGSVPFEYSSIPLDIFTNQLETRSYRQIADVFLQHTACFLLSQHNWKPLEIKKIDSLAEIFILYFENFSIHLTDEGKVIVLTENHTNDKFVLNNSILYGNLERVVSKEFFEEAANLKMAEDRMVLFDKFEERTPK